MLVVALTLTGCGDDDAVAPSTTSTTTTSPTAPTTTEAASVAVDVEAALIDAGDLPDTWQAADDAVGEVDPANGFCGRFVSVRHLDTLRTRPYAATDTGPWIVSGIAVFDTADAARDYLAAVDGTTGCPGWTDDAGVRNAVEPAPPPPDDGADETLALHQTASVDTASFSIDIAYLRVDRAVGFVTRTARSDATSDVDWTALLSVAASRLVGAVG